MTFPNPRGAIRTAKPLFTAVGEGAMVVVAYVVAVVVLEVDRFSP